MLKSLSYFRCVIFSPTFDDRCLLCFYFLLCNFLFSVLLVYLQTNKLLLTQANSYWYDLSLHVNALGPGRLLSFAKYCKKLKLFLHISTGMSLCFAYKDYSTWFIGSFFQIFSKIYAIDVLKLNNFTFIPKSCSITEPCSLCYKKGNCLRATALKSLMGGSHSNREKKLLPPFLKDTYSRKIFCS